MLPTLEHLQRTFSDLLADPRYFAGQELKTEIFFFSLLLIREISGEPRALVNVCTAMRNKLQGNLHFDDSCCQQSTSPHVLSSFSLFLTSPTLISLHLRSAREQADSIDADPRPSAARPRKTLVLRGVLQGEEHTHSSWAPERWRGEESLLRGRWRLILALWVGEGGS